MASGVPHHRDHRSESNGHQRSLGLLAIPLLGTSFGFVTGFAIDQQLATTAFGLVWGVLAMLLAPGLARRGRGSEIWARAPLYVACALAFVSLGGATLSRLLTTDTSLAFEILREPAYGAFFASIHMTFEWLLLPAVLMLNWHSRRRWLLVVAAVSFYALRMVSAVYFAPISMEWGALPDDAVLTGGLAEEIETWLDLGLLRAAFQEWLVTALLVVATARRAAAGQGRVTAS